MSRKYFYPLCSNHWFSSNFSSAHPPVLPKGDKAVQQVLVLPLYGDLKELVIEYISSLIFNLKSQLKLCQK